MKIEELEYCKELTKTLNPKLITCEALFIDPYGELQEWNSNDPDMQEIAFKAEEKSLPIHLCIHRAQNSSNLVEAMREIRDEFIPYLLSPIVEEEKVEVKKKKLKDGEES